MSSTSSKIIRTIAIFVIVFVLLGLGAWYVMEHGFKNFSFSLSNGYVIEPLTGVYQDKSSYKVDATGIKEIQVDWVYSSVDILVYEGKDILLVESCQRDFQQGEELSYSIKDGILKIVFLKDNSLRRIPPKKIVISLPKDIAVNLKVLNVNCDLAAITVTDLNSETIYLESNTGSIDISNVQASKTITLDTDTGTINAISLKASNIVMKSDTGRITAKKLNITENIDLNTDTGRIIVTDVKADVLNCASDTGRIECDKYTVNSVSLKSDVGSIDTEGSFKDGNFRSSTGSITIRSGSVADKMYARSDTGSITLYTIKSEKLTVSYSTDVGKFNTDFPVLISSSNDATITLKSSTGNIYIKEYEVR